LDGLRAALLLDTLPAVEAEIDRLSDGAYGAALAAHIANLAAGGDMRTAHPLRALWKAYAYAARRTVEVPLTQPETWQGENIVAVSVVPLSVDAGRHQRWPDLDYRLAVFLERTEPGDAWDLRVNANGVAGG